MLGLTQGTVLGLTHKQASNLLRRKRFRVSGNAANPLEFQWFGLWIGVGTGRLAASGHGAALAAGANVTLGLRDATKGIFSVGGVGLGKTIGVVNSCAVQLFDQECGVFIIDIRGDLLPQLQAAANMVGRSLQRIGVGQLGVNLISGLSPDTATSFITTALRLTGQGDGDSGFGVQLVATRVRSALTILQHSAGDYTLRGLYRFHFDKSYRDRAIERAQDALAQRVDVVRIHGDDPQRDHEVRRINVALEFESVNVANYTDKELSGLSRTLETGLARFTDPELEDAFCSATVQDQANLEELLDGAAFVVNVDAAKFRDSAKIVYCLLKERFFTVVKSRADMAQGPRRSRPIAFLCDEYQQCASIDDGSFFNTYSRALNCIPIVTTQSLEEIERALDDDTAATALIENFTNVIAFRSSEATMEWAAKKLGEVEVYKVTSTVGSGTSNSNSGGGSSSNTGQSVTTQRQRVLNAQDFRTMDPSEALALLSIDGRAYDDVIWVAVVGARGRRAGPRGRCPLRSARETRNKGPGARFGAPDGS